VLNASEINPPFIAATARTFERWRDSVPNSFRFAVKLPGAITHFAVWRAATTSRPHSSVMCRAEKPAPVLVLLPASFHFERRRAN
jgi:uncharacterized protein YecE (DUF72 family)